MKLLKKCRSVSEIERSNILSIEMQYFDIRPINQRMVTPTSSKHWAYKWEPFYKLCTGISTNQQILQPKKGASGPTSRSKL